MPATPAAAPFRVALTGGIASGKTTVARLFAARGVPLIDTDVIAREVVEPGQPALDAVVAAFGPEVLGPDGRLDRRRLRDIVFADAAARGRLESILHPAIRAEMERQSRAAAVVGPYQVLVIPLLAEGGRRDHVDRVLVVDAPEIVQLERLMARDAVTREQATRRAAGPGVTRGAARHRRRCGYQQRWGRGAGAAGGGAACAVPAARAREGRPHPNPLPQAGGVDPHPACGRPLPQAGEGVEVVPVNDNPAQ